MPAQLILIEWECPKCGHKERQPRVVSSVVHCCKGGRDNVEFKRNEEHVSNEGATSSQTVC